MPDGHKNPLFFLPAVHFIRLLCSAALKSLVSWDGLRFIRCPGGRYEPILLFFYDEVPRERDACFGRTSRPAKCLRESSDPESGRL